MTCCSKMVFEKDLMRTLSAVLALTLFRMGFSGATQGWEGVVGGKMTPSLKCFTYTYNDETRHTYTVLKEDPTNI